MYSRRQLLRVAPLTVVGLSGCLGDTDTGEATQSATATPTSASETSASQPTAGTRTTTPTSAPAPTSTPSATATPTPTATVTPSATETVRIDRGSFEPRRLSVEPNTLVRWVNDGVDDHRVESMQVADATTAWEYASATFGRDGAVSRVFREPGVYAYFSPTYGRSASSGLVAVGDTAFDGDLPCESGY